MGIQSPDPEGSGVFSSPSLVVTASAAAHRGSWAAPCWWRTPTRVLLSPRAARHTLETRRKRLSASCNLQEEIHICMSALSKKPLLLEQRCACFLPLPAAPWAHGHRRAQENPQFSLSWHCWVTSCTFLSPQQLQLRCSSLDSL